jgi:putative transposase
LVLSHAGVVIDSWWHTIPNRFPSVMLDAVVVMPNHVHAAIHLGTDPGSSERPRLGDVMHWFKTRTTYDYILGVKSEGWPRFPGRLWQKKYYDHIISSDRELDRVRAYIEGTPDKWTDDEYHVHEPA